MKYALLAALALVGLAGCKSDYNEPTRTSIQSQPPANPTGSVGYQGGGGPTATDDTAAPNRATGSVGYQKSGRGTPDTITAAPPRNPTGSVGYQK